MVKLAPPVRPPAQEAAVDNLDQATALVKQSFDFVAANLRVRVAQAESMAPSGVPAVRYALSRTTFAECEAIAAAARDAQDAASGRAAVEKMIDPEALLAL